MVSLGPYHHGKQLNYSRAEAFKHHCLQSTTEGRVSQTVLYNKISNVIDEIRDCYAEVSIVEQYDNEALTLMMLLDSCFILNFMENLAHNRWDNWKSGLGVNEAIQFTGRDIMVLENQIPLFVLDLVIKEIYISRRREGREIIQKFLSWILSVDFEDAEIPRNDEDLPLHILEACHRVLAEEHIHPGLRKSDKDSLLASSFRFMRRPRLRDRLIYHSSCPSVTYLKKRGIGIRPSSSHSLNDIKFLSYSVYGQLHLPVRAVSDLTQVFLSNMIAYEISPDATTDLTVLSYTNLMKSLIRSPADVKELHDKNVLPLLRSSEEEVVKIFQSIDTYGLVNIKLYEDVVQKVGEHCSQRWKTWMPELVDRKLKSPLTIIGLLTAMLLLILTFLQTWYTIHPVG